jgi:hypothetical protein
MLPMKFFQVANGALWLVYEAMSGAFAVMIGEVFGIIFATIAIVRLSVRRP